MKLRLFIIGIIIAAAAAGLPSEQRPSALPVNAEIIPADIPVDRDEPPPAADPVPSTYPEIRGLYMPAAIADDPEAAATLLTYARDSGFTAIVVDVKDDVGTVSDRSRLASVIRESGLVPIARIVACSDPAAVELNPELALRTPDGEIWTDSAENAWLDASLPQTRALIVDLASLAIEWGFEEIHLDRAHFPDLRLIGPDSPDSLDRISIVSSFLSAIARESGARSVSAGMAGRSTGAYDDLGSGQDLATAADAADFVSPRLFASELDITGLYGLDAPLSAFDTTVSLALREAALLLGGTARLRPWLEDPGAGAQAVITAAHGVGVTSWILYREDGQYSPGLDPTTEVVPYMPPEPGPGVWPPNELGRAMILMYHEVGQEEGRWARQRDNFRSDLQTLYDEGYRLVSLRDYVTGNIDLPRGYSPVVLTFDDSTAGQFRYLVHDGTLIVDPNSAVGILEQFCRQHPDFGRAATFYILPQRPFGQSTLSDLKLRHITASGMDLGNHTWTHADLSRTPEAETAYQLALPVEHVRRVTGGYIMDTLALPYGTYPADRHHLHSGEHDGIAYDNIAILLVGAEPALSPFDHSFNPLFLPRVQATDIQLDRWLGHFRANPHDRYVSDGDPATITFPASEQHRLNERAVGTKTVVID